MSYSDKELITDIHPSWLDTFVSPDYEDNELYKIILFYVIHSPCIGQSARRISLQDRGWKVKPWYSHNYLKDRLDKAIFGDDKPLLKKVDSKTEMKKEAKNFDLEEDFYLKRTHQRALFTKAPNFDSSIYMSLFYRIRNSLAHGRLAMYPTSDNDIMFVLEDGKEINKQFVVSARIIIRKSSLLNVINVISNPPIENDYSQDILIAIENGKKTKKDIMEYLSIDNNTYNKYIDQLKILGKIIYMHNRWEIVK